MKITLYDYAYETFAIQFLAATLLKKGHDVDVYFDCSMSMDINQDLFYVPFFSLTEDKVARAILKSNPQVVGFSIITAFYPKLSKIIRKLKEMKPGIIIVAGGAHCNILPEETLKNPDIDFMFIGDADLSLPALIERLERNTPDQVKVLPKEAMPGVSNIYMGAAIDRGMGPAMENLDDVPFPLKEPYYRKNPSLKSLYTTMASRGCLFTCTYCNSNNLRKIYHGCGQKYFRTRSVARLIAELEFAKKTYKPSHIMFLDDLFGPRREWLIEFVKDYKEKIGLPFFCESNPNVHTAEDLDLLADAGCVMIEFGFQSAKEEVRKNILHRYESNDSIRSLVKRAHERKIFVLVDHIANLPGETQADLDQAVDFYKEIRPDWVNLAYLQYFPKAEIIDIALSMGALDKEQVPYISTGEKMSAVRLLPKLKMSLYSRTFALRLFCAFKLPPWLCEPLIRMLDVKMFAGILSYTMPVFIYFSRIFWAYTDRRDFMVRHHVLRNLYVMGTVFKEKYLTLSRP